MTLYTAASFHPLWLRDALAIISASFLFPAFTETYPRKTPPVQNDTKYLIIFTPYFVLGPLFNFKPQPASSPRYDADGGDHMPGVESLIHNDSPFGL